MGSLYALGFVALVTHLRPACRHAGMPGARLTLEPGFPQDYFLGPPPFEPAAQP